MRTNLFALKDRIDPSKDIDERELIHTVNIINEIEDRPRRFWEPGRFDRHEAFQQIADYQRSRGLKPDSIVRPKGPTQMRIAAEHHTQTRGAKSARHYRALGRGANVPLNAGVGPGQPNRADDLTTTARVLTLAGHPTKMPDTTKPTSQAAIISQRLAKFQKQHGEIVDGTMKPGGPTQNLLSNIAAPYVDNLISTTHSKTKPWQPPTPQIVARVLKDRPCTIRTFEQDARTLPTKAEHDATQGLLSAVNARSLLDYVISPAQAAGSRSPNPPRHRGPTPPRREYTSREIWEWITDTYSDDTLERMAEWKKDMEAYRERYIDPQGINGRPTSNEGDAYSGNDTYGDPDGR